MNTRTKKIVRNILFLLMIPIVIGVFVFANIKSNEDVCQKIEIQITNKDISFVTPKDIALTIKSKGIIPTETKVKAIHANEIENELKANPWIANASVYVNSNQILFANIEQKIPVVRIQQQDSSSYGYYLDSLANPVQLSSQYTALVPIVSARKLGFTKQDLDIKTSLIQLAQYIQNDTFWNVMIGQIILNNNNEIDLVPQVGNQLIKFGQIDENINEKFNHLYAFYQQQIHKITWKNIDEIDVRFKHQIICRNTSGESIQVKELQNNKSIVHTKTKDNVFASKSSHKVQPAMASNSKVNHLVVNKKAVIKKIIPQKETAKTTITKNNISKPFKK